MRFSIRFLLSLAALAALSTEALAQSESLRVGFLTVRTGPLAAGGKQMEDGINESAAHFLSARCNCRVLVDTADDGGPDRFRSRHQGQSRVRARV